MAAGHRPRPVLEKVPPRIDEILSVVARGKGLRLQHLTPVPQGNSQGEISAAVLAEVEQT